MIILQWLTAILIKIGGYIWAFKSGVTKEKLRNEKENNRFSHRAKVLRDELRFDSAKRRKLRKRFTRK